MRRVSQEKKENNPCNFKYRSYNINMKTKNKQELIKQINAWERARKNVKVGSKMYMNISSRIHRLNLKLKGAK